MIPESRYPGNQYRLGFVLRSRVRSRYLGPGPAVNPSLEACRSGVPDRLPASHSPGPSTETEPPLGASRAARLRSQVCGSGPCPRKGAKLPAGCQRPFSPESPHRDRVGPSRTRHEYIHVGSTFGHPWPNTVLDGPTRSRRSLEDSPPGFRRKVRAAFLTRGGSAAK